MKRFKASLSIKGINSLIDELNGYKRQIDSLTEMFLNRLAEIGIQEAKARINIDLFDLGDVSNYIYLHKEVEIGTEMIALVSAHKISDYISMYYDSEGNAVLEQVNPLLMAEFGSGKKAIVPNEDGFTSPNGVGRGTFPRSDGKRSKGNQDSWIWRDSTGWHKSDGIKPTQPMYRAWLEMKSQINQVAKEIFKQ